MTTPDKPELDYSYTAFQQSQGNNTFPGTQLDNDLANLKQAIDQTIDFTSLVVRADGKLNNGSVTKESLDESLLLGIAPPRQWATGTVYAVDDTVFTGNTLYICVIAHTAGVFATDLVVGRWQAYATFEPLSSVTDGSITEPKHATGGVSTRALADGAVTTDKQADGATTRVKLAAAVQATLLPVGAEMDFSGVFPPPGWLLKAGQALSRVTYSALFAVLCPSLSVSTTSGSPVLSAASLDLRGLGLEGVAIEGTGIPGGATVVSVTAATITLSSNATVTNTGVQARMFPNGSGDGSTTFNLPDDRGRASFGRDGMGGTAAGRVKSTDYGASDVNGARLGASGGADRVALTSSDQIPAHAHPASTSINDPGHAHGPGSGSAFQNSTGGTATHDYIGGGQSTTTSGTTGTSTTGITVSTSVQSTGGGLAHPNMPPARVSNKIIFTGVI